MAAKIRIEPLRYRVTISTLGAAHQFELSLAMIEEMHRCAEKAVWRSGSAVKALLDRGLIVPAPGRLQSTTRGDRRGMTGCEVLPDQLPEDELKAYRSRYEASGGTTVEFFYSERFHMTKRGRDVLAAVRAFDKRAGGGAAE